MANELERTNAPAKRSRSRWLKVLGIVLGVFLVLLLVGYFVLTSSAGIKRFILPQVSKAMNAEVTASDVDLSLFKEIVLKDLKVQTTGPEPVFVAPELRVRYSLMDIIKGLYKIPEITIKTPTIVVVQKPDGTSTLDPLLEDDSPSETYHVDIGKISATDGTVRYVMLGEGGSRDVFELSQANLGMENIKNGETGKLTFTSAVGLENNAPAPGTNGTLKGQMTGDFSFTLDKELMPSAINGSSKFSVNQAAGSLAAASGFSATLNSDITPTDIRQVLLSFAKGPTNLGQLRVAGPFDMAKTEGRITAELKGIDKGLFNMLGAPYGLDFGGTTLSATNQVQIASAGKIVTAGGEFDLSRFQVIRTNQASPALDLTAAYDVTVDMNASNAVLRGLTVNGTQQGKALVRGELSSPMNISWGNASSQVGDSTLNLVLTNFNLADWKPFVGEVAPAGMVGGQLRLTSQRGGELLAFDLKSQINDLTVVADTNRVSNLGVVMQVSGTATNLENYQLPQFRFEVSQQRAPILVASGAATYNAKDDTAATQVSGQLFLDRAAGLVPQPDVSVTSGIVELGARVTKKQETINVLANATLTNLSAKFGTTELKNFTTTADADLAMNNEQFQIRKLDGRLFEAGKPGGVYQLSGAYNLTNSALQLSAKLAGVNENGIRPFLESMMTDKRLVSVSLNGDASVQYAPEQASEFKANMAMTNLVVQDLKNPAPPTPLEAKLGLDASLNKEVLDIRNASLGLTPTTRAANVVQLTGRVDMTHTNAITGNVKLGADSLDLTRYYDLFEGQSAATGAVQTTSVPKPAPAPAATTAPEQEPEAMQLPVTNFVADAAIGRMYLREVEITNAQTTLRIDGAKITMKPFQMALNGAPVKSSLDLDLGVAGYRYDFGLTAAQVPLAPLVNSFQPERRGQVAGTLTGQAQIAGAGTTGTALQKNLKGNFDIGTTNLNLAIPSLRNPLLKTIINVVAIVPELLKNPNTTATSALSTLTGTLFGGSGNRQRTGLVDDLMQNPVDIIQARGAIGSGRVDLEHSLIQSPAFQAGAQGAILLRDILTNSVLDIPLTVSLKRSVAEKINFVPAGTPTNQEYVKLPQYVTIKGTLGDPKSDINKVALLGTALQQLGGVIPGVDQKTGSLIQNLGGVLTGRGSAGTNAPAGTNQPSPANLLKDLGGILGGPQTATNTTPGTSTNKPPGGQSSRTSELLQGIGSLIGGAQATTNAPASGTNATQSATNAANPAAGLLQGIGSLLGGRSATNAPK